MEREIETTGKDVQDAVDKALKELGVSIEKVNVEILCQGGMFKKAKVKVKLQQPQELEEEFVFDKEQEVVPQAQDEVAQIEQEQEKIDVDALDIPHTYVARFLEKALQDYKAGIQVVEKKQNKVFNLKIKGEGTEKLGKTEVVNALQTLLNAIEKEHNRANDRRIIVNIGDYEERRKEQLEKEATKCADQAIGEGRTIRMQPMNSYERHIIHDFLQDRPEVIAESFGVEPYRYITIRPNDKKEEEM